MNSAPMPEIKYQHAIIEGCGSKIISINEVTTENRKQYKFCCIGCGHELLPRAIDSKYRKPHFYHKEIVNCSGETYLHKLAKRTIKDMFEKDDTFFVEYMATEVCNNSECKYRNSWCRKERVPKRINLKAYYDTCQEEACINGFVADILLTNSRKPNVPPILIEICVSHPCEEDKRNSGLHIIEIKINKEQDIIDLRKEKFWCEDEYVRKRDQIIEFISFNNEIRCQKHIKLERYIYNPRQNLLGYLTKVDCCKAQYKLRTDSHVELNVINLKGYGVYDQEIIWIIWLWMAKHKGLRRCNMCKFYYATQYEDYPKCRLYKKYGKPEYPSMDEAEKCRSFCLRDIVPFFYNLEELFIEEVTLPPLLMKPEYKVILTTSRSFDNYNLYKEKFMHFLSAKKETHSLVVIPASKIADMLTNRLSEDIDIIKEPHKAEWEKYGKNAINISNDKIVNIANALIAFWDGKSVGIKNLIDKAKEKGLKVAVVKY